MAGEMKELAETPLGRAIEEGNPKAVKTLIQQGEDVLRQDRKENTYLHYVCTMYRPCVINILIVSGININHQNKFGNTALHVTALQNEPCHVTDLMAASIKTNIKNWEGKTAKDIGENSSVWMDLYKKYEPTLREALRIHDVERVEYLLRAWSACHLTQNGKDIRQYAAGLKYHDMVTLIDKHRFSIGAVYAVLERDHRKLSYCLSRGADCDVNFVQQLTGSGPHHILQLAIKQQDAKMVGMILEADADINIRVNIKEYFRGPLYFAAINFDENFKRQITRSVMSADPDLSAVDERGRSALIYVIDRRNGHVTEEFVKMLLKEGINIAMRDETGCTARNVALLARRRDIVKVIDKHLMQFVKSSDVEALWKLAIEGYDDIIVTNSYRDTWIYAAGNDSRDVEEFLEGLSEYTDLAKKCHLAVKNGDLQELESIISGYTHSDQLLKNKDKGGRGLLLKALLYNHRDVVHWLLERMPCLASKECDNMQRTALHYAHSLHEESESLIKLLLKNGATYTDDCSGLSPKNLKQKRPNFLAEEQNKVFGLEKVMHCMKKYEELFGIIRSKRRSVVHFENVLKQVNYPVKDFSKLFMPDGMSLVSNYRCLLLAAIDYRRVDIATRLVNIKVDCSRREEYITKDGATVWMNASERATSLGLKELANYIKEKRKF